MWVCYLLVNNFGLAIIIFTFIVKAAMFPLNIKQQKNMAASQLFQPKVQEIQKKYKNMCKLINRETNVLLLDEPTNHLDADAKEELKRALKAYKGSILLICHEPEFFEGLATDVWDCTKWTTRIF